VFGETVLFMGFLRPYKKLGKAGGMQVMIYAKKMENGKEAAKAKIYRVTKDFLHGRVFKKGVAYDHRFWFAGDKISNFAKAWGALRFFGNRKVLKKGTIKMCDDAANQLERILRAHDKESLIGMQQGTLARLYKSNPFNKTQSKEAVKIARSKGKVEAAPREFSSLLDFRFIPNNLKGAKLLMWNATGAFFIYNSHKMFCGPDAITLNRLCPRIRRNQKAFEGDHCEGEHKDIQVGQEDVENQGQGRWRNSNCEVHWIRKHLGPASCTCCDGRLDLNGRNG